MPAAAVPQLSSLLKPSARPLFSSILILSSFLFLRRRQRETRKKIFRRRQNLNSDTKSPSMARSFSNAKLLSVTVMDRFSTSLIRRGYVAASGGAAAAAAAGSSNATKKTEEEIVGSAENVSWVPDPVTGYYRPENRGNEVDVAELRASLLNKKK